MFKHVRKLAVISVPFVVVAWFVVPTQVVQAAPAAMNAPTMGAPAMAAPMARRPAVRPAAMTPMARPAARPAPRPAAKSVAAPAPAPAAAPAAMDVAVPAMPAVAAPTPLPVTATAAPTTTTVPAPTPAPTVQQDSKGSVIGGWALQIVLYLLGILIAALIPVLTSWLYKKFKLTDLEQKAKIDEIVLKAVMVGIGSAQEAAYKMRDNPIDSAAKLDLAIKKANEYLVDSGLPEKGAAYLATLIESKLGMTRDDTKAAATEDAPKEEEPKEAAEEPKEDK